MAGALAVSCPGALGFEPTPECIGEMVDRAGRDYDRWLSLVRQCGYCHRPIRLVGGVRQRDKATGEVRQVYSTEGEPDGCLLLPCGTRRAALCQSCAAVRKVDTYFVVLEGMVGGSTVPASVATHPMVFATFTAPSFGAVHGARRNGYRMEPCRARSHRGDRCEHGVREGCWERHREDDPRIGTPLCPECFDYEGQVLWNRLAPKLWTRTIINLRRTLARLAGMTVKEFEGTLRKPEFAKVGEYQRRGALHFHGIFRLDGRGEDGEIVAPPAVFTTELLAQAIEETVGDTEVRPKELPEDRPALRWGTELHVRPLRKGGPNSGEVTTEAVATYIAKYSTKGSEGLAVGDGPSPHIARLMETARELDACPEFGKLRLLEAANDLGFRGHFSTKSRRYSTSLAAKRRQRITYARRKKAEGGDLLDAWGRPEGEEAIVIETYWRFGGQGYKTGGEAWLALSAAAWAREMKRVGRDEIRALRYLATAA
jgi:replication initiator protein RepSA